MLIHEWMRFRDKHLPRREPGGEELEPALEEAAPEAPAERPQSVPMVETPDETESEALPPTAQTPPVVVTADEKEAGEGNVVAIEERSRARAPSPPRQPVTTGFPEVPEAQSRRLQALLGRQGRLPLEVAPSPAPRRGHAEPAETREELIERLLDPILSINEAATLCGVCPASIRRYTNRGVLKCFRTPGNQRRFRLSDVLDFMERQQEELLD